MNDKLKAIIKDIPSLEDNQLNQVGEVYAEMYEDYLKSLGKDVSETKETKTILDALNAEKNKRLARKSYDHVPNTYQELMTIILSNDRLDGLSKEDLK